MQSYIELINCFESKEGKFFWIEKLVNSGEITPSLGGYLITYFNL